MSTIKGFLKNRVLVTLFAVAIIWLSLSAGFANNASARACLYGVEVLFYTDATKTDLCGYSNTCLGEAWGCTTSRYREGEKIVCWCE